MNKRLTVLAPILTLLISEVASAAVPLDEKDCKTPGELYSNADLRNQLIKDAGVEITVELARSLVDNKLGDVAFALRDKCLTPGSCSGTEKEYSDLYYLAKSAVGTDYLDGPDAFRTTTDRAALAEETDPPEHDRTRAFLNGKWSWLRIVCVAPRGSHEAATSPVEDKESKVASYLDTVVVGKSSDDADAPFKKRGFATFAYTDDHVKKTSTTDVSVYVGFPTPMTGGPDNFLWGIRPGVGYHRQTGTDGVNNLDFDLSMFALPGRGSDTIALKFGFGTDDKFESKLWTTEFTWATGLLDVCWRHRVLNVIYPSCSLSFVGDYVDVADAGDKADLLKLPSYFRLGADLETELQYAVPHDSGLIVLDADYSMRRDVDGRDANVDLGTFSLGYQPGDASPVKISIEYKTGRELTSLENQNLLSLTFGIRR